MKVINFSEVQIKKYIERIRPPEEVRDQVDISYWFQNDVIEIFEVRPKWDNHKEKINIPVARAKYIKSKKVWRIYWKNSKDKWIKYGAKPEVEKFSDFIVILEKDENHCFWG